MTAYPATATQTAQRGPQAGDVKAKARSLRDRLIRGLDLILDAQAQGDQAKVETLQKFYKQLEAQYTEAKKAYATTPEDLFRCPDCPRLGKGKLYDLAGEEVICDSPCTKGRTE